MVHFASILFTLSYLRFLISFYHLSFILVFIYPFIFCWWWWWWCHPPFKATLTGFRKTRLRKVHFCPRLAETKRKNIILDHMNSRICLGCSRYWLHKSDLNTTNTAISLNQWERGLNDNVIIVTHFPPMDIQSNLMGPMSEFGTPKIWPRGP